MQRDRVTLILGAGHSQALGLPGTAVITEAVESAIVSSPYERCFAPLRDRLRKRHADRYSFETIAAALECAEQFRLVRDHEDDWDGYDNVLPDVARPCDDIDPQISKPLYSIVMNAVREVLNIDWLTTLDSKRDRDVKDFYDYLFSIFQLDIATLNYDRTVEHFVPFLNDGFAEGHFNSKAFVSGEGCKIAHLHGALDLALSGNEFVRVPMANLADSEVQRWAVRADGVFISSMITGLEKPNKLTFPPYSIYHAWLGRCLLENPRVIIVGYGAGDVYVNAWLYAAARHHGPDFRAIIIDRFSHYFGPSKFQKALAGFAEGKTDIDIDGGKFDWGYGYLRNSIWLYGGGFPDISLDDMLTFLTEPRAEANAREFQAYEGFEKARKRSLSELMQPTNRRWRCFDPQPQRFEDLIRCCGSALSVALLSARHGEPLEFEASSMDGQHGQNYRIYRIKIEAVPARACIKTTVMTKKGDHTDSEWFLTPFSDVVEIIRKNLGDRSCKDMERFISQNCIGTMAGTEEQRH